MGRRCVVSRGDWKALQRGGILCWCAASAGRVRTAQILGEHVRYTTASPAALHVRCCQQTAQAARGHAVNTRGVAHQHHAHIMYGRSSAPGILQYLLDCGVKIPDGVEPAWYKSITPTSIYGRSGSPGILRYLLECGVKMPESVEQRVSCAVLCQVAGRTPKALNSVQLLPRSTSWTR